MTEPYGNDRNSIWLATTLALVAIVAPWWSLSWAGVSSAHAWPATVEPFGLNRIALVHLLASSALAWFLADGIVKTCTLNRGSMCLALCVGIGSALSLASIHFGKDIGSAFATTDFVGRLIVRVTWASLLVLPWMVAIRVLIRRAAPEPATAGRVVVNLALVLSVAVVLPAVYAQREIRKKTGEAAALLNDGRLWEAWQVLDQLSALGSRVPVGNAMPYDKMLQIGSTIDKITESVQQPLHESASDLNRIGRASQWIALGQMEQAQEVLRPAAENNPQAALLLATVQEERREYASCIDACQRAVSLVNRPDADSTSAELDDAEKRILRENAYGRWAEVLRKMGQYRAAEDVLRDGLDKCRGSEAHFHFELASHYTMGGRPRDALTHYERAAELDEQYAPLTEAAIRELTLNTPICLLRPIRSATR